MKARVQEKAEAIKLRRLGHSYKEIMERVPVAKSSLSHWLTHLELTDEQLKKIEERMQKGRNKARFQAILTNRKKRIEREKQVFLMANKEFNEYINDPFFIIGLTMYWAEGSKKHPGFQFVNSDPKIIEIMAKWITKYLKISKEYIGVRLYIHHVYAHENCELFWAGILKIPIVSFKKTIYKPTPHTTKKNPNYKGCIRLEVGKINNYRRVMAWQKLLSEYIIEKWI